MGEKPDRVWLEFDDEGEVTSTCARQKNDYYTPFVPEATLTALRDAAEEVVEATPGRVRADALIRLKAVLATLPKRTNEGEAT